MCVHGSDGECQLVTRLDTDRHIREVYHGPVAPPGFEPGIEDLQ